MTIITRRDNHKIVLYETENVTLDESNFQDMNLEGGLFTYQSAKRCNFINANLRWTHWRNGDLSYSILNNADLTDSNFLWAKLINIHACKAIMRNIYALASDFSNSTLINSYFNKADMRSAKLIGCDLTDSILTNSNLTAYFTNSCLYNANLSYSWFYRYDLREHVANMHNTNLSQTIFFKSDLRGVNLSDTMYDNINMEYSFYDVNTKWPENFNPEASGAIILSPGVNISNMDLSNTHLERAILSDIHAREVSFHGACLHNSDFSHGNIEQADFSYCYLIGSSFESSNLKETSFYNARVARCNFRNADIRGADMRFDMHHFNSYKDSNQEFNLKSAKYDKSTLWPEGFDPKEWDK